MPTLDQYVDAVRTGPSGLFSAGDMSRLRAHAEDGAAGAELIASLGATSIVDVGSGGGVPAFPLAIALDGVDVHLVESLAWKAEFLASCAASLELESRVTVHCVRAEEAVASVGRELMDVGTARAVSRPGVVAEYLSPLVRVGGNLVLWSTTSQLDELDPEPAQRRLGLGEPRAVPAPSELRDQGILLVWPKERVCDENIPRRTGVAARKPLR